MFRDDSRCRRYCFTPTHPLWRLSSTNRPTGMDVSLSEFRVCTVDNTFAVGIFLETDRMTLSWFTEHDIDALVDLDSDPAVMQYINGGQPVDHTEVASNLDYWLASYSTDGSFGFWKAEAKSSGQFIGWFHFRPKLGESPTRPELGYRIRRADWGQGLATEGSRALIDMGFRRLAIDGVYAQTMAVNWASRRVMEKSGLRFVRTFVADWPVRIVGDELGDVEFAITRQQWEADWGANGPE